MKITSLVHLTLILVLLGTACSHPVALKRAPSSEPKSLSYQREKEFINAKIYRYTGPLKNRVIRAFANLIIRSKVKKFLKDIKLSKKVQDSVMAKIKSKDFRDQFVPFLLAMMELYTADEAFEKNNFENHIKRIFPNPEAMPGLAHSLFTYNSKKDAKNKKVKEKNNKPEKKGLSNIFMGKVVELVDQVIIADPEYKLGSKHTFDDAKIKMTMPYVKEMFSQLFSEIEVDESYKEIADGIVADPKRLEALTASLIEVVIRSIHEHYQTFARKYHQKEVMQNWLFSEIRKPNGGELFDYVHESLHERRYGMHVVVDGLQGQLMKSLMAPHGDEFFIRQVWEEHQKRMELKPKTIETKMTADQQLDFLDFLKGLKRPYSNPYYLPYFKKMYQQHEKTIAIQGVSTTPTISVRNVPMATTGAPVAGEGGTKLPNFHYVDREQDRAFYFFGNDALRINEINDDLGMKTIAQRLPWMNTLNCHAQWGYGTDMTFEPLVNLAAGEISRDFGEVLCLSELERRVKVEKDLRGIRAELLKFKPNVVAHYAKSQEPYQPSKKMQRLLKALADKENEGMPQYLIYYNPWPDHFAHFKGPFSDEIISMTGELNRLDYWLGRVDAIYRKAGIQDQTLFGMAGDHGLSPVYHLLNPEVVVFDFLKESGRQIVMKKISSDEGEGPKLNHPFKPESVKGIDIVIASTAGGNYMIDVFNENESEWREQPLYEDVRDHRFLSGDRMDLVDEIITKLDDTLEYAAIREKKCTPDSTDVLLIRKENGKELISRVKRRGDRVYYDINGADLLEVTKYNPYRQHKNVDQFQELYKKCVGNAVESDVATWCFEDEWRLLGSYSAKPDGVNQMAHLYDSDLSGTINLFPKYGIGYNSKVPGRHAGEHFHEKDAFVGVWGPVVSSQKQLISAENGSIPVVMYEYLSGTKTERGKEGWGFPSFIEQLDFSF
jgi:hypothetical protein